VKNESTHRQVASALNEGWMEGGSFFGSVLAGTLVGYLLDWWLGTDPWLVVAGIVVGSYAGFLRMWQYMKKMDGPGTQ
jgi:ATP synthase protein I